MSINKFFKLFNFLEFDVLFDEIVTEKNKPQNEHKNISAMCGHSVINTKLTGISGLLRVYNITRHDV